MVDAEVEEGMVLDVEADSDADRLSLAVLVALPELEAVLAFWPETLNSCD